MATVDAVVIGAGAVGLAVARHLAQAGFGCVVLERHAGVGEETSSRNSEVIHAGIYYPKNSHKAVLCVRGREMLYDYCRSKSIGHRRCGKIIVAREDQRAQLTLLAEQAAKNGVADLRWLDKAEVAELEPAVAADIALLSPSTGIVDSHEYMLALIADIESADGHVATRSNFLEAKAEGSHFNVTIETEETRYELRTRFLVNAGGLAATEVASRIGDTVASRRTYYAKGSYFSYRGASPFSRLVYPLPEAAGLGIHATLDLSGRVRFGPDVEWIDNIETQVDPEKRDKFVAAIGRYWPDVVRDRLEPDYAGVRPKLSPAGAPAGDFVIEGPADHGVRGLVNLFGIESPGLTASLALAEVVAQRIEETAL